MDSTAKTLRPRDYLLLGCLCWLIFGVALVDGRILNIHETVHCQNVQEMLADGDWLIPHYGGRVWLERPPLPHWLTAVPAVLSGRPGEPWALTLGSIAMGMALVALVASLAARWYGRVIGLLAGAILATTQEVVKYATAPECDIFLCGLVAAALALFAENCVPGRPDEDLGFVGGRRWSLLGFFVLLGLVNMAKGLFFGMLHITLPVVAWLLWNRDLPGLRRLSWLWGWLAFLAAAVAWPAYAYWRVPDVTELWWADYGGRTVGGYMREPWWYYLANVPWMLFPWTILGLDGLRLTAREAWSTRYSPARFLWAWALTPIVFFSLLRGKHHHYLLHAVAPWSILAAHATLRLWHVASQTASRWRNPAWSVVVVGLPGVAVLIVLRQRLEQPAWLVPTLAVGWPALAWGLWWVFCQRDGRVAFAGGFGLLAAAWLVMTLYQTALRAKYQPDLEFLQRAARTAATAPLYVLNEPKGPLSASWVLFYLERPAELLHNDTFLRDERIARGQAYVIARRSAQAALERYGAVELLDQAVVCRDPRDREGSRWALFRLRFDPDLRRAAGPVRISPAQAAGRIAGPYLE
ncbi:MAG: glycosyltransferase family 39 protein [Gemmataceae bacterium]|nr:glycosyltransferase family 39 protein [Gemmataceae bacterium]